MFASLWLAAACAAQAPAPRLFADRPVAWHEHDDQNLDRAPAPYPLEDENVGLFVRDFITRENDRHLALARPRPAADVNALDEVACSTWFCPRHHLAPLSPAALAAGPPDDGPPVLPLTITKGKPAGAQPGFVARDARGRRYLIKLDPLGYPGMATGAEIVGNRLFHAAGYNVAGGHVLDLAPAQLLLAPDATYELSHVVERRFTELHLAAMLDRVARDDRGHLRAAAVSWLPGKVLGAFDMQGRRRDDANDRIPHEDRRSLRATLLLFAWLNNQDAGTLNTLDSVIEQDGRRFVRHAFIDFGDSLGSFGSSPKAAFVGRERLLEVGRMLASAGSLGLYQRAWQADARATEGDAASPTLGFAAPDPRWRPEDFRTSRKVPAHERLRAADAYWGAKVITAFRDPDLRAVVGAASYDERTAAQVLALLRSRRDAIAAADLLAFAAVERPALAGDGRGLCFDDLAIARGYRQAATVRYRFDLGDGAGASFGAGELPAQGDRSCLPLAPPAGAAYLVVTIGLAGEAALPSRVHVGWREAEQRYVVLGLERDP
jgi:hypothetical protein